MRKIFKIKYLFAFLGILIIVKLIIVGSFIFSQTYKVSAREEKINYSCCPPEIFEIINLERKNIYEKAKEIELKEKKLKLLESRIKEQMLALKELENVIDEKLKKIEIIQDKRTKLLVKAISEMRASKAAKVLLNMDKEMAIKILSQLKSSEIASILSAMPPDKAASLSEALSGYPPKEY